MQIWSNMKNTRQENRKIYIILAIIIAIGVLIVTGVLNVPKVNLFFHSNISDNNSVMSNTIEVIVGYVCLTIGILIFSVSMIAFLQHNQKVDGIIKENIDAAIITPAAKPKNAL